MYGRLWSAVSRVSGFHFSGSLPMMSTEASWLSIVIDFAFAGSPISFSQGERCLNGALAVIFGRPKFDARVKIISGAPLNFSPTCLTKRQVPLRTPFVLEDRRGTSHPCPGEEGRVNASPGGVCECHAFPVRQFAHARLPHGCTRDTGNVHRVARLFRIKFHQARARKRRGERAVSHVVPPARANTGPRRKTDIGRHRQVRSRRSIPAHLRRRFPPQPAAAEILSLGCAGSFER